MYVHGKGKYDAYVSNRRGVLANKKESCFYMEWFSNYFLPLFTTILSGVVIYLLGQYFYVVWLIPLQEYKKIRAEIARKLLLYANVYSNVVKCDEFSEELRKEHIEVMDQLRILAAELEGYIQTLYWFRLGIPSKKKLSQVVSSIVLLSNSCIDPYPTQQSKMNHDEANKIRKLLQIYRYDG